MIRWELGVKWLEARSRCCLSQTGYETLRLGGNRSLGPRGAIASSASVQLRERGPQSSRPPQNAPCERTGLLLSSSRRTRGLGRRQFHDPAVAPDVAG